LETEVQRIYQDLADHQAAYLSVSTDEERDKAGNATSWTLHDALSSEKEWRKRREDEGN